VQYVGIAVTAAVTLLAVALGGWLSTRTNERQWQREHERQWRDIRLKAYIDFLTAYREYVAFVLEPESRVVCVPHPRKPGENMPFFDRAETPYKERFEATKTAVRLVSRDAATVEAMSAVVRHARRVAACRATRGIDAIPQPEFDQLWDAERAFVAAARGELNVASSPRACDSAEPHPAEIR
jgi:hypothetical protein